MKGITFEKIIQTAILGVLLASLAVVVFRINPMIQHDRHNIGLQNAQLQRIEIALHKIHVVVHETTRTGTAAEAKHSPVVVIKTKPPMKIVKPTKHHVSPPKVAEPPPQVHHTSPPPVTPSPFVPPPAAVSEALPVIPAPETPGPPQPIRETLCAVKTLPFCS